MLTEEHKKARLGRVTSSVAAAVLDLDPYSSPYDAMLRITGQSTFEGNQATRRGTWLEPALLQFLRDKTGMDVKPAPFVSHEDWSGDSADGLLVNSLGETHAVVEAKSVGLHSMHQWGDPGTDDIPEHYLVQCHWHMLHHPQADVCLVPAIFERGLTFEIYEVPRDRAFEAHIQQTARDWHQRHIINKEPVPVGASHADTQALTKKHPRDWDPLLECSEDLASLLLRRVEADKKSKDAKKELDKINNELRSVIGDHSGIDAAALGYSVTYRKNNDGAETNWQKIAHELGAREELIYRHTQVVPGSRVLRVAKKRQSREAQNTDQED